MSDIDDARRTLRETFGFTQFRGGQEQAITALLEGRPVLAVFPTGAGKSLCYQLPALLLDGLTVVVSPLIALMKDQVDFLVRRGVAAARLDSTLEPVEARRILDDLRADRLKLLYVAPERLASERFFQTLSKTKVALLAVDEAHCISEWGHNFRPEYLKLARLARRLGIARVLALTATATPDVASQVARAFGIADADVVITGFHRPNLELHANACAAEDRHALLLKSLKAGLAGPTIVYVTLQKTAEDLADFLAGQGFDAMAYHAGMNDERRHVVQDQFMACEAGIVVATIAFGMGIDKSNIRAVYHFNLPKSLENFAQEIGRAGRDGEPARCELFACAEDVLTLGNFTYGDTPTPEAIADLLKEILGLGPTFDISAYDLSQRHDIRQLVVQTLMTYLELEGILEATGPFYSDCKFRPLRSSGEILAQYDAPRAAFLRQVFRQARPGKIWFALDVSEVARNLEETRERISAALNHLEEKGDVELQLAGLRQGYRRTTGDPDLDELRERLVARFLDRERRDIARVHSVLEYAQAEGCLTGRLLAYFGETLVGDCGHCARCLGEPPIPLPPVPERALGSLEQEMVERVRSERHKALTSSRQLTRFLCGLVSPASSRSKLAKHPQFAALADVPFPRVLDFVKSVYN
ncbi:RecQ family ATP-dependent DNA helicase [Singulisphaera acidiphila]|uniref:ATP-dependent DNA helicase RecQ n=1 Tax=Singulisphaera acidiphila (strain ATCC BAA-1392 / DSM 18658 / VKM B-2454 / MOB10) TaxID=886293 RepID=L0DJ43_SINAD|nr:ATP-dependent DNA helicase RecQ [Singulisphaera acidiphila]AGA28843.1 ATP-dependent DNA helicase, RecQ family [Singulisphaera acidiphila DSM 18658]